MKGKRQSRGEQLRHSKWLENKTRDMELNQVSITSNK